MRTPIPYACPLCGSRLPRAAARCFVCGHSLPVYKGRPQAQAADAAADLGELRACELPRVYVTTDDYAPLKRLAEDPSCDDAARELLRRELDRAIVCDAAAVPPDVVRLGSTVWLRDRGAHGVTQKLTGVLTLPGERPARLPAIPASSPLGAAVLGLAAGDTMIYAAGDGRRHAASVVRVAPPGGGRDDGPGATAA